MKLDFSIIIPYYNKKYEIDLVLMALCMQNYDIRKFEVVIVDDGSKEKIFNIINKYKDKININYLLKNHTGNRGKLRNYGIKISKADRIIMLDSDMIPDRNVLSEFDKATKNSREIVSLGCRINLLKFDKDKIDSEVIKNNFEIIKELPAIYDERTINIILEKEKGFIYDQNWQIVFSHCLCLWKEEFLKVNGFDEGFSKNWGAEDVELGYRLFKNGCKPKLNLNVKCYHLYHDTNLRKNILSLRKNYEIFLRKHYTWHVELFIREYEIWAKEGIEIQNKIKSRINLIEENNINNKIDEIIKLLPEKTLLVGIESKHLLDSYKIEKAFIPESKITSDKIFNIIGFNTFYKDKHFKLALISKKYLDINYGLYLRLINEIERISQNYIIVDKYEEIFNKLKLETNNSTLKNKNYLLFSLSNENNFDIFHNNFIYLAIAMDKLGINTGIQYAFDPFNLIDINSGYMWFSDRSKQKTIARLQNHQLNFICDKIPHFINYQYLLNSSRSVENKIVWIDSLFINYEKFLNSIVEEAKIAFFVKNWEIANFTNKTVKHYLPVGIDSDKINNIKKIKKNKTDKFVFLFTNQFIDKISNLDILLEVFDELYSNDNTVELKIITSNKYYPTFKYLEYFCSKSFLHFVNETTFSSLNRNTIYQTELKNKYKSSKNIIFIEENFGDLEYTMELNNCDCLLYLNSGITISSFVLESIAFGKKPIIPEDNRYSDYFNNDKCFGVKTEKVSPLFSAYYDWPLNNDLQPPFSYLLGNRIIKDSLKETLKEITDNRDSVIIDESFTHEFIQKFDWLTIGEKLKKILY